MSTAVSRPRFTIAAILKFTALCGLMLALLRGNAFDPIVGNQGLLSIAYPLGISVFCALWMMQPRLAAPACRACGGRCLPRRISGPDPLCPTCRQAKLPARQRRRRESSALAVVTLLLLALSFLILGPLVSFVPAPFGAIAYAAGGAALFVALFVAYVAVMIVRQVAASLRMRRPGQGLKVARAFAGAPSAEARLGMVSVYGFGTKEPIPTLEAEIAACRDGFARLVGEPADADRPLQVLSFGSRETFDAFFRKAFLFVGNHDGFYVPWTPATIVLTTESRAPALSDPGRLVRNLLGYFYLDSSKKSPLPQWLESGIGCVLAGDGDPGPRARLNRKMLASLSKGTALGTDDLFHIHPRKWLALQRDFEDHGKFTTCSQFGAQSWSIVEYLGGEEAAEDRRERFRGFLRDVQAKGTHEDDFTRHFGYGYAALLEGWRAWVVAQGIGTHEPLPPGLRPVLRGRVIPTIRDRDARPLERILAVREMGRAGYVEGADALIELLGTDDAIPAGEVAWSLEAISGLALGRDPGPWRDWFDSLPEEATRVGGPARYP